MHQWKLRLEQLLQWLSLDHASGTLQMVNDQCPKYDAHTSKQYVLCTADSFFHWAFGRISENSLSIIHQWHQPPAAKAQWPCSCKTALTIRKSVSTKMMWKGHVWSKLLICLWTCTALTNGIDIVMYLFLDKCSHCFAICSCFKTYESHKSKIRGTLPCWCEMWMVNCQSLLWEGSMLVYIARYDCDSLGFLWTTSVSYNYYCTSLFRTTVQLFFQNFLSTTM